MSHHHEGDQQHQPKTAQNRIKYWRATDELEQDPNVKAEPAPEFLDSPTREGNSDGTDGHSRREFLKIMGASIAMLGTTACTRRPTEKIVPYMNKPEDVTPGVANWYASTCGECGGGCGIVVKSREGRPIKFEGNANHPVNQGGLCARGQASVLSVYDPDRARSAIETGRKNGSGQISWDDLDSKVVAKLQSLKASGGRVRVLTGDINSPSTNKVIGEFLGGFAGGKRVSYDVLGAEEVAAAAELSYGSRVVPRYRFDRADMIVSFGADFLGTWLSPVEFNKQFSKTRKVGANAEQKGKRDMSRFVAFESIMTLTGSNADDRYPVKSGDEFKLAAAIAHELIVTQGRSRFAGDSNVRGALAPFAAAATAQSLGVSADVIKKTAQELWDARGKSLVVGGGHSVKGDVGVALEVVVNLINSALDNDGVTIDGTAGTLNDSGSYTQLTKLIDDMKAGQVDALFIYGTNPVYSLPKALGFEDALSKVGLVVTFSRYVDETAAVSDYLAATPHHTEAWGDASQYAGVYNIQQPTISPLYQTRGFEDSLIAWGKKLGAGGSLAAAPNWHEYLKNNWRDTVYRNQGSATPFMLWWENVLREGFIGAPRSDSRARSFSAAALRVVPAPTFNKDSALVLFPTVAMYDGSMANNGWLQELPDPVTKVTWDNYVMVSPNTAKSMGVKEGDVLKLATDKGTVELPAYIQPGLNDQTFGVPVGYGRKVSRFKVGNEIGKNVFPLATDGKYGLSMAALKVSVSKTGANYPLATSQKHHSLEGRDEHILREMTAKDYQHNPKGHHDHHEPVTIWPKHQYPGYRWGMAIDLNSCTGCSACVIGCQSENNIPVVGKKFVMTSREMHWLRIDRYYSGRADQPKTQHQPMLCQHCENAPCETVCPVLATMHDHEGLNQQVYNRCVGTRYCANNCPYKVRRFNWFTFTDVEEPQNLQYNPDISVRTRGVMEKCTFCFQRIRDAKDRAKDFGVKVKDGDLKTACQQSCPTDAIIFGDINDKTSRVSQIASDPRGFHVLEELNTRPSITYLTKIRNTET